MLKYIFIDNNNKDKYQNDFIELYCECFGDPSSEMYNYEEVAKIWKTHVENGVIIVCEIDNKVIGFICGYLANKYITEDLQRLLNIVDNNTNVSLKEIIDINRTIYIYAMAVKKEYRRRGIAKKMVELLFDKFRKNIDGISYFLMETDTENSKSAPLFIKYYQAKQPEIPVKGVWYGILE